MDKHQSPEIALQLVRWAFQVPNIAERKDSPIMLHIGNIKKYHNKVYLTSLLKMNINHKVITASRALRGF